MKGRKDLPAYERPPVCSAPECDRTSSLEPHHLWRRSFTGGARDWVEFPYGEHGAHLLIGNVVMLCHEHHRRVTEAKALIDFVPQYLRLDWGGQHEPQEALDPQPPIFTNPDDVRDWAKAQKARPAPGKAQDVQAGDCPTCGQPKRKKRTQSLTGPRKLTRLVIMVPKDHLEDGAEVLNTLIELARSGLSELGYDQDTPTYFILVAVLHDFITREEKT